jgi:hypothetical protein
MSTCPVIALHPSATDHTSPLKRRILPVHGAVLAAWAFILLVTAYDMHFAWYYRCVLEAWELNPVASYLGRNYGIGIMLGFRCATVMFAAGLAAYCHYSHKRCAILLTLVILFLHFVLSLYYLFDFRS